MLRKTLDQFPLARPYLIVTVIAVALFWPTWFRLVGEWLKWEQVLAHGLPTFAIFIGLLLIHPPAPADSRTRRGFSIAGSLALIATVAVWALLELVRIDTLTYLMLPAGLVALAWALLGFRAMLRFLPYVLLFGLSLPIWSDLVPYLVRLATVVVGEMVSALGITALIEGANITLPYGRLVIADGCSGIRYFAISILLAMIIAILNDYRWKGWCVVISIAMLLGLTANWARITALVYIAYESNMESSLVTDHETFGWLVFAAFVAPAMLLAPAHRRSQRDFAAPVFPPGKGMMILVVCFLLGPLGLAIAHSTSAAPPPWQPLNSELQAMPPSQLPIPLTLPEPMTHETWKTPDGNWVSLGQSTRSGAGEKLVPYLPRSLHNSDWFLVQEQHPPARVYQHLSSRQKVVVYQRFLVGSYHADNYWVAKLLQIPATLMGQGRFALLTLQAPCGPRDCSNAVKWITDQVAKDTLTMAASKPE